MKAFLAILLLLPASVHAGDWDKTDTALLTSALVVTAVDWGQTRTIARNPDRFHEHNPFLGSHPSTGAVDKYFTVAMLGTVGIAIALPQTQRRWFLGGVTFLETVVVISNDRIGIRASF